MDSKAGKRHHCSLQWLLVSSCVFIYIYTIAWAQHIKLTLKKNLKIRFICLYTSTNMQLSNVFTVRKNKKKKKTSFSWSEDTTEKQGFIMAHNAITPFQTESVKVLLWAIGAFILGKMGNESQVRIIFFKLSFSSKLNVPNINYSSHWHKKKKKELAAKWTI